GTVAAGGANPAPAAMLTAIKSSGRWFVGLLITRDYLNRDNVDTIPLRGNQMVCPHSSFHTARHELTANHTALRARPRCSRHFVSWEHRDAPTSFLLL